MATPLAVFDVQVSNVYQGQAIDYAWAQRSMSLALTTALQSMDQSKRAGIHWAGSGPRVTRRIREGLLQFGGNVRVVAVLVSDTPPGMNPTQLQGFLRGIKDDLSQQYADGYSSWSGAYHDVTTNVDMVPFSVQNGPLTFWESGTAAVTHTRDRFPATNALGVPSSDQNENPIGPNDPNLVPVAAPDVSPASVSDLTSLFKTLGLAAVGIGAAYVAISYAGRMNAERRLENRLGKTAWRGSLTGGRSLRASFPRPNPSRPLYSEGLPGCRLL